MKLFFEDKFFDEEEREGFVVCEKMKRAWAAEMKVLSEIIRVCEKYNILCDLWNTFGSGKA